MAAPLAAKAIISVARSKTGRRVISGVLLFVLAIVSIPVFLVGGAVTVLSGGSSPESCEPPSKAEGFTSEQLANAQTIAAVGDELKVPEAGVKIAVMVALVESELTNLANSTVPESVKLPHQGKPGDNADSVGVFQQRPSQGWGTVKELMTPTFAAKAFFGGKSGPNGGDPAGLLDIEGWESMTAGAAAQAVQGSKLPHKYAERSFDADTVMKAVAGTVTDCENTNPGEVPPKVVGGWSNPVGLQPWATYPGHSGGAIDVWVGVGTPIYAAAAGVVHDLSEGCGGLVLGVQHDPQYTTVSAHLSQMVVKAGTQVKAGQLIGYSGATGACVDGAHLHFEVRTGPNPNMFGTFVPAYKFLRERGITMGPCQWGCHLYPM